MNCRFFLFFFAKFAVDTKLNLRCNLQRNVCCVAKLQEKIASYNMALRENELLFRCQALLVGNFLRFARARAHLRALMTQKSCAVGMPNAILRNY